MKDNWQFYSALKFIWSVAAVSQIWGGTISNALAAAPSNNIHAVLVASSRYWFNYRHAMNVLGLYEILQENGVPDDQIILMIADEYATNARNPYKNGMYASGVGKETWYTNATEIDYRGSDVTVQNFMDSVLGTAPKSLDRLDEESNLLIYVTGHGGDQFFKFQDEEELTAQDISNMMSELYQRKKYKQALLIADTCQAFTLFDKVTTPNVLALGTSLRGENAYAHHSDSQLGLSVIERWTYAFLQQYKKNPSDQATLHQIMVAPFAGHAPLGAHVGTLDEHSQRKFAEVFVAEFFGVRNARRRSKRQTMRLVEAFSPSARPLRPKQAIEKTNVPPAKIPFTSQEKSPSETLEPFEANFLVLVLLLLVAVFMSSTMGKTPAESQRQLNSSYG